jgi:hypothetical protein
MGITTTSHHRNTVCIFCIFCTLHFSFLQIFAACILLSSNARDVAAIAARARDGAGRMKGRRNREPPESPEVDGEVYQPYLRPR